MNLEEKAFKGTYWLSLFKFASQIFSWIITITVARILSPEDYGLMEMATVITGYAMMFSELGLGAAIIQKPDIEKRQLSSVFWFSFMFCCFLGLCCVFVAYPTAIIFNEPRVIPITQTVSILFVMSGLQIVPLNLLKKELEFKKIGIIEMSAVMVSCVSMYFIANAGGGVWTLIGGHIVRVFTQTILIYYFVKWIPVFHFNFKEAKIYLNFGITVALGQSFYYFYEKSDKFFAARAWSAISLGYYSFALQLAKIPTEKIVVLINQVAFSAFSALQDDSERFNKFYLNLVKITGIIILPLFVGGFLLADDIINILLNEKWYNIIPLFKWLCLAQIFTAINAINNHVHTAQGRPHWGLNINIVFSIFMPISFFIAVRYGLTAILIPWLTIYVLICSIWIIITLKKIGVSIVSYCHSLLYPICGTLVMINFLIFTEEPISKIFNFPPYSLTFLIIKVLGGVFCYIAFFWIFDRKTILTINNFRKM